MSNDCLNCKWAEWVMTKHKKPRINKNFYGKCLYPVNVEAIKEVLPYSLLKGHISSSNLEYINNYKNALWADKEVICHLKEEK